MQKKSDENGMERICKLIKRYWWQCILGGIMVIIAAPFMAEFIIRKGPYRPNTFDEQTWFSFMGSYLGAVFTVMIFLFTLCINKISIDDEIKRNRKNAEIEREIKKAEYIYNFFTLRDYKLQDLEVEMAEFRRLLSDLIIIKTYVEQVECLNEPSDNYEKSKKDFYDCVKTENFLLQINIGYEMQQLSDNNDKRLKEFSELIFKIVQNRNSYIQEMTNRYESYIDTLIKQIY